MLKKCQLSEGKISFKTADYPDNADAPIWVFINPDEHEKRLLIDKLEIDEHNLISALDPDEQARVEFEPNHIAFILKRPKNYSADDNFLFKVVSSGFFLFNDRLVIIMSEDVPIFDGKPSSKLFSITDVMLRIIANVSIHFLQHLRIIMNITDELEAQINEAIENKNLLNLFKLQKSLVYYLNGIHTNSILIDKLRHNPDKFRLSQEQIEFIDDIYIDNQQCYKQAEIYSNILSGLMDARVSIVNNNLNVLMKTLNMITLVLMVPTLIVSTFSMNVKTPFQQHPYAFWIIMFLAFLSIGVFIGLWRHYKKW